MLDRNLSKQADYLDGLARQLSHQAALLRHEANRPAMTYEDVMLVFLAEQETSK